MFHMLYVYITAQQLNSLKFVRSEVLMAMSMTMAVFWDAGPYSLVDIDSHLQHMKIQNGQDSTCSESVMTYFTILLVSALI
jgi:hypothetical protein